MKPLNWRGGLKRLGLIYASCSAVAVGAVLIGEPFWFTVCPSSYTLGPKPDPVDQQRYAQDIRQQIDSGCSIRTPPTSLAGKAHWRREIEQRRLAGGDVSLAHLGDQSRPVSPQAAALAEQAAERLGQLGLPKLPPRCEPVAPLAYLPAETVQVNLPEVVLCSVESSFWTITESRGLRLALFLLSLPLVGFGIFKTGRWVWRGFRSP